MTVERVRAGAAAGFCTVLLTTLMNLAGRRLGVLSPVMDLRRMAPFINAEKLSALALASGIGLHVTTGTAEGAAYGLVVRQPSAQTGIGFMTAMWAIMMIVVMAREDQRQLGRRDKVHLTVATLVLHWLFGAIMGGTAALGARR